MREYMKKMIQLAIFANFALMVCLISPLYARSTTESIVLAGGCFWGMESVFDHTKGVIEAVAGYAGGRSDSANYNMVSGGDTGHAESVKVTFDPQKVSLSQLLDIYFTVAHNPTELNYQGPDHGMQYRSTVFYATPEQRKALQAKITELTAHHVFAKPIVTTLEPLKGFFPAEDYHQHYAEKHPLDPYILINDAPKLSKFKSTYHALYKE
jgi:peptide-methionine (S)-S-oxide reductase